MSYALALGLASLLSLQLGAPREIAALDGIYSTFPPADDDVLRPRNLRPLAFGKPATPPIFSLVRSDDSVVIVDAVVVEAGLEDGFDDTGIFAVTLPELAENEDVRLEVACDACPVVGVFGFAIGAGVDDVTPAFRDGVGSFGFMTGIGGNVLPLRTAFGVDVCLPALQASEDVMVRLSGPDVVTPVLTMAFAGCSDGSDGLGVNLQVDGGAEREICVDAVAVDVAGHESAPITVCGELVDGTGCAATRLPPPLGVLGLALVLVRRRRRRRF